MSLSHAIVATMSLTLTDPCIEARDMAREIARARDANVPITTVLDIVDGSSLWVKMTAVIYSTPELPPVAVGVMTEAACRG